MLQGESLFLLLFVFKDQPKNCNKTDGSGVLAWESPNFLATSLPLANFDKFNFIQATGSLIVEIVYKRFSPNGNNLESFFKLVAKFQCVYNFFF